MFPLRRVPWVADALVCGVVSVTGGHGRESCPFCPFFARARVCVSASMKNDEFVVIQLRLGRAPLCKWPRCLQLHTRFVGALVHLSASTACALKGLVGCSIAALVTRPLLCNTRFTCVVEFSCAPLLVYGLALRLCRSMRFLATPRNDFSNEKLHCGSNCTTFESLGGHGSHASQDGLGTSAFHARLTHMRGHKQWRARHNTSTRCQPTNPNLRQRAAVWHGARVEVTQWCCPGSECAAASQATRTLRGQDQSAQRA